MIELYFSLEYLSSKKHSLISGQFSKDFDKIFELNFNSKVFNSENILFSNIIFLQFLIDIFFK
jgi:hypothetical protein